jgi:hypothetical protein
MFLYVLRHLKSPKTYQPAREKNKQEKITKSMQIFLNMAFIYGKGLESTNQFCISYKRIDKLTTHLDQQMFLMNHINAIILSQSIKQSLKKNVRKMSGFKSWLYENDIVCFVLNEAENIPARGRKTEKNITLA